MAVPIRPPGRRLTLRYADEHIAVKRLPRPDVRSRVLIRVHPDGEVVVLAPDDADDDTVLAALQKRARWVHEQRRDFAAARAHAMPRQYVSGETHFYLGKQHRLKVLCDPHREPEVKLRRGALTVTTRQRHRNTVRTLLTEWYAHRARAVFNDRLDALLDRTLWVKAKPPIRLVSMKAQWGNCSPAGRITLNPNLVKAPRPCIDYVILHELCHHAEHNHSPRFYRLLTRVMPEWERTKARLDSLAAVLVE